ncbi:MAG: hypothetical protein DRQ78_01585 [Epsilonproteobacteria bacterium]|nr:MAG: hypothetical protein DRQ78_01585 [Campylobacterota bacterium]
MTINLLQTPEYRELMSIHISQTISYLFKQNQEFSIACDLKYTTFSPLLPTEISNSFKETVLFVISGYTFEMAGMDEEYFTFEAGFGNDNFGSTVTIPLLAIKQVFLGDNPIVLNLSNPVLEEEKYKTTKKTSRKSSMEALLNNPENKKLLQKNKS